MALPKDNAASNGPRLKKDGTPFAKRGEGGAAVKRPAYLVYKQAIDGTGSASGEIEIIEATRKADVVMDQISKDRDLKYARFEI